MRVRSLFLAALLVAASAAEAADRWIPISGSVGVFRSDARVFNPSFEKDIQVTARFLPAAAPPASNAQIVSNAGVTFTVPKRSMHILNDVVTTLFSASGVGALLFTSDDPFEVTSRIYAQQGQDTFGQFAPGFAADLARLKGAVLQMKASGARGTRGTFRTNVGVLNIGNADTTVQWRLYDRNNALVGRGETVIPAYGVTPPLAMADGFFWNQQAPGTADLSDGWISFSASNPVLVYASVLDNGTEDQTFIPAVEDVGVEGTPQPQPTTHTFDVSLEDFSITFSPSPVSRDIRVGDRIVLRIRRLDGTHGFSVAGPTFATVVPDTRPTGTTAVERSFDVTAPGTYQYFCTVTTCGAGHGNMFGSFSVADSGVNGPRPGY